MRSLEQDLYLDKMEEPHFIVDEQLEKRLDFLNSISRAVKKPIAYDLRTIFLRRFTMGLIEAAAHRRRKIEKGELVDGLLNFRGIDEMIMDPDVNAIYCNGPNNPLLVNYGDKGKIATRVQFKTKKEVNDVIKKFAKRGNLNPDKNPILDFGFDGFRVEATLGNEILNPRFVLRRINDI